MTNFLKIAFFALLAISLSRCKQAESKVPEETNNIEDKSTITEVEAEVISLAPFSKELSANGKLKAYEKVELRTKLNEPVARILVKNGQFVNKGQLIAIVDTSDLYFSYVRQKAQFEKAQLDYADMLLGQGYRINNKADIPEEQLRNAELRSGITLSKTDMRIAEEKYRSAFIKAPVSGNVANLTLTQGNYPENGGYICSIINNRSLLVDFYILEEEAHLLRTGLKVEISPFYNDKVTQTGTISAINPTVDNGLIMVTARLNGNNTTLYDGVTVKVLVKSGFSKQLSVPKEAIVLRTGRKVVFTYNSEKSQAEWKYVQTGEENSTHVVVTEGLESGDTVITSGNLHLGHEVPVSISSINNS